MFFKKLLRNILYKLYDVKVSFIRKSNKCLYHKNCFVETNICPYCGNKGFLHSDLSTNLRLTSKKLRNCPKCFESYKIIKLFF